MGTKIKNKRDGGRVAMEYKYRLREAVILASGYGRRMRRTKDSPSKPMIPIGDKPLISYIIDLLIGSGIEKIYVVHHSVTSDVRDLLTYHAHYTNYLEFIEEKEQKGTLLSFSRVKHMVSPPFLLAFEDIIADQDDFRDMLNIGLQSIGTDTDLVIQTVRQPSLLSERAFLTKEGQIVRYEKNGITGEISGIQEKKYGGMISLWLASPFPLMDSYLSMKNYRLSSFLEEYIPTHTVSEMPIHDMWDIDTPEAAAMTKELLKRRGGGNGCIKL
jgi:NDP-sugar pyrophosphorylase family protein